MITLNQEEIQLACKRFVKEQYNIDTTENPSEGIQLKVIMNEFPRNTARIIAEVVTKDKESK